MKNENGIERSAILKGQTLDSYLSVEGDVELNKIYSLTKNFDNNTKYLFIVNVITLNDSGKIIVGEFENFSYKNEFTIGNLQLGLNKKVITTNVSCSQIKFDNTSTDLLFNQLMIIPYQEGMENWDIPYFEGMQSVKMPVLTTTGKNLLDKNIIVDEHQNHNYLWTKKYNDQPGVSIKPNTNYSFSLSDFKGDGKIILWSKGNKSREVNILTALKGGLFTTNSTEDGFSFYASVTNDGDAKTHTAQLEESSSITPYEPFKSNILTVNEEVELRGIGDVKDTLDLMTGEVVECIGEIVLDGSEIWNYHENLSTVALAVFSVYNDFGYLEWLGAGSILCDKFPVTQERATGSNSQEGIYDKDAWAGKNKIPLIINKDRLSSVSVDGLKLWLSNNQLKLQFKLQNKSIKTVDLIIQDQDNQPQERMKLFPNGYINTSSSTFPPILELKGITHNNKLNMTTTNGTNNTQLTTLDNLALDGIICRDGTVVRDSYDVESGLYTKRVFRFTIDEDFVEKYRSNWQSTSNNVCFEINVSQAITGLPKPSSSITGIASNITYYSVGDINRVCVTSEGILCIRLLKEELITYNVDGIIDWIKRNGDIEVAYQLATPKIIHIQPNMQPYVSTRPYQGSIESQGNILESSFLDYTSEQSIISPKPLGDGDVLRWEQGSQCYVYENDKEYIPLTDYNQPMGTVLDLEEEDGEQFVENLDGGDIIVDVPFKEKAVYERHLVPHEDNVIYPTQDKLDPTGKIEVDYICGATWQNPNDLADIRHVGTLREDGQYDVTIRRSGDDEIRLMNGITNLSLDGDGLNPSEFELTFFNSGGVEVGKYGDTSHTLEDCVLDSKLETGMVYGETLVNLIDTSLFYNATLSQINRNDDGWITISANENYVLARHKYQNNLKPDTLYTLIVDVKTNTCSGPLTLIDKLGGGEPESAFAIHSYAIQSKATGRFIQTLTTKSDLSNVKCDFRVVLSNAAKTGESVVFRYMLLEGDYTSYPMDIPFFEGVGSTIVNGFTTVGKNLFGFNDKYEIRNSLTKHEILDMNSIIVSPDTTSLNWINAGFYNYYLPHKTTDYFIISRKEEVINGNPYDSLNLYDADDDVQMIRVDVWEHDGYKHDLVQFRKDGERANIRFYCGSNEKMGTIKYSDIQITKYSQRPSRVNEEFEPYKGITYTLPSPITLNKIGDVADTYDVVSGVETRNVERIIFDDNIDYTVANFNNTTKYYYVYTGGFDSIITDNAYDKGDYISTISYGKFNVVSGSESSKFDSLGDITFVSTGSNSKARFVIKKSLLDNYGLATNAQNAKAYFRDNPVNVIITRKTPQTIQHTLIPSTVETMQEPTFILPQPLRSVPNGICDRLYWDENKGHYCIEKRVEELKIPLYDDSKTMLFSFSTAWIYRYTVNANAALFTNPTKLSNNITIRNIDSDYDVLIYSDKIDIYVGLTSSDVEANLVEDLTNRQRIVYYTLATSEIIDLPHLNKKLTLPTQPNTLPIGYKVEYPKANPQLGLTIPYKQLNYPSRPQNIDFKMDIADYVLTWDDVKEARQYNIILNDRTIATVKEPQWNSGEEMYGYIMVEAQNELAENLSEELYIKTVPNAPAQLTVAHNPMTDYYDFEISFIKTSAIAEYYTVQYRIDDGDWVYKTIQSDEIDPNSKVLWKFSVYEIHEQIEVWATATNDIGTNDILPTATYYMSPTPQWTYRINSKELFVRWMDDSPYDTQYKLRYQYKSDGIYRYAYFEGDKQEIGKLYEALIPLADDEEVSIALCVISEKENLYTKPIKASKELDPNIKPPKNFNYHWLARGLIEFYWEDNYDVDVEYEAIVEHRLTSGNNEWITDTRIFSATDTEGTGTVYRLSYQLEDLEEIRVKVRMKWAMNETEWSESLTTVFIPVEGNPPQWIRRTQTQEGLLVEWEAQEYVDSYHVYVMSNGEELQHLETMDNFIYVDLDYSNPIDIEIYEATRFSGGIQSDPSDKMQFRPTMDKHQLIHDVVTPDTLTYEIEVDTVQKGIKERQVIHDINTTPKVTSKEPMDVAISSLFTLSFHPLQLDVHQSGSKYYGDTELHIKTLDVKSRDAIEVLSFERITDQYGVDFTVYTPSASKYPITLEVNRVRIVCFGDSLTSGHPGFWAETGTGDPQHCYEYWLDRRLKGQYEIINKGYGSDTTDRMLARFDRDVLANNPQYCIIQGGTNDLYWAMAESMGDQEALDMKLDVMKANIMEMVKRCWDNNITPIVGNLIPRTGATGIYKTALYDFNAWIISWCTGQAAEGRNIFYVDLFNAGKEAVPPTPIEDPTNPGAMNPIYDGDALFDEFGNIIKQGRGIHLNKEGYRIWAEAIPLSIFKTYDSGLRMYKDLHCTDEDNYDDSDKQNPFYTISVDNVRRSKTKTVVRYIKNIGKTQVLFAMYASDEYNMSIEFVGSDGEKGAYANGLLAPNMIAKVTMEINLDNKDSKASFNLHLAAREYNQN